MILLVIGCIYASNFWFVACWSEWRIGRPLKITQREVMLNWLLPGRVFFFW